MNNKVNEAAKAYYRFLDQLDSGLRCIKISDRDDLGSVPYSHIELEMTELELNDGLRHQSTYVSLAGVLQKWDCLLVPSEAKAKELCKKWDLDESYISGADAFPFGGFGY